MGLDQQILQAIEKRPGQLAREIAAELGVDRRRVNAALYGRLKSKVQQDKRYRWYLKNAGGVETAREQVPQRLNTSLARLCRYYLDCLSHDDLGGVREFAASKYGDLNYVELEALPMFNDGGGNPFESEAGRRLLGRIRRDRNRQTMFLGYPVRLNLIRSRKGWEGFMVEPLLLFSFEEGDGRYGEPSLAEELPQINFAALRGLSNTGETSLMEEAIQLADELGMGNTAADQPDLDELLARLCEIQPDWDWQEEIDPYTLSGGTPLSLIDKPGIYNRGILVAAERSPYTRGLETELGMLQSVAENNYEDTALGAWLSGETFDSSVADEHPLLEVLPLNSEQRQAVRQALSNPLTVVTGPPGTGKSQVVTSILINASWQGESVLFASKNNKAVDVVETRVNALGPRPVLLRLGANQYQSSLAEYLVSLLAAKATPDDHESYREHKNIHAQLSDRSSELDMELEAFVNLRNDVDRLEQGVEQIREAFGTEGLQRLRTVDFASVEQAARTLQDSIQRANKAKQDFLTRLIWPLVRSARFSQLAQAAEQFRQTSHQLGLPVPDTRPDTAAVDEWIEYGSRLTGYLPQVAAVLEYFRRLEALTEAKSLEEMSKDRRSLTEKLAVNSQALWRAWLQLQPARMDPGQRRLLGDYSALLQMIVGANEQNERLGRDVFRRYSELFPKITSIFSSWAVTSLSARGRVPFEPSFFDLLVIDEASQCDIASALPLMFRARRVVVIGDPQQLRHISTLSKQQDQQLLSKHSLVEECPGWSYSSRSLFDLASSLCRSEDIVALRDHHRSHADIIGFSNEAFYGNRLRVATNYDRLRFPRTGDPAVRWVDIQGKAFRPATGGAVNQEEAEAVVKEIGRLLSQGYRGSIGVVSPFRAQANRIRDLAFSSDKLAPHIVHTDFLTDTVHKFQGDERDVIIFSPVVSSGVSRTALGFLRNNPNLFNVAITRARAALIVVGDMEAALNSDVDYLERFARYAVEVGSPAPETGIEPTVHLGPVYPPVSHPERVSEWERFFYGVMYRNGIRSVPQYPVEKYVLDFAVFGGERRLNIEVDGERYHRNWNGELCRRDQIRNQRLMELGWDVLRFWVYQVRDDLERCVVRVQEWIEQKD